MLFFFFSQEDTRKKFSSFILSPLIHSGCRNKEKASPSPCTRCCRVAVLFTTWFLPLSSRQRRHSRNLQTADFLTEVTFMCLNLILFPPPAGDSFPSKIPLKLITSESSLLSKHSLSFYRRQFNIFELFTFFPPNFPPTYILHILPPQQSSWVAIPRGKVCHTYRKP